MLPSNLIRMISDHWEHIARRVLRQIGSDPRLVEMGRLPEGELLERTREILQNLGVWLVSREQEIAERYEALGRRRFEEGIPLHEVVSALQLIRENMIQYVRDQIFADSPLELYAEGELDRGSARIFDRIIYNFVRGYEQAMRDRWAPAHGPAAGRVH